MKIQKVIIKNLATLEDAVIDFCNGPLQNSPLFLICGDTGAGKSTITDAVCLSLYGQTPRFSNINGEDIEVENSTISKTNDTRNIIRYGATEAMAATIFATEDNTVYKAEWSVHRARKKTDGTLMSAINTLYISKNNDEKFEVVTEKQTEFKTQIEKITGLDFDRYVRCVMLAQNQFSKFLYADKDTKSKILQMLTNTDIYEKISIEIHRKYSDCKSQKESLESEIRNIILMSDDEINQAQSNIENIKNSLLQHQKISEDLSAQINWKKTYLDLQKTFSEKNTELENANKAVENSKSKRLIEKQLEIAVSVFGPLYENLNTINQDISKLQNTFSSLQNSYYQYFTNYKFLCKTNNSLNLEIENLEQKYNEMSAQHNIYENIQTIDSLLENYNNVNKKIKDENAKIENSKKQIEDFSKKLELKSTEFNKLYNALQTTKNEVEKLSKDLGTIDIQNINTNYEKLESKTKVILGTQNLFSEYNNFKQNVEKSNKLITGNNNKISETQNEIQKLNTECLKAQTEFDTVTKMYQSMKDAATESVEKMRSNLKPNEPCPVCGSLEHPYANQVEDFFKTQLQTVEKQRTESETKFKNIQIEISSKQNLTKTLQETCDKEKPELEKYQNDLSKHKERLLKALTYFNKEESLELKTIEELEKILSVLNDKIETQKTELNKKKQDYTNLTNQLNKIRSEYDSAQQKLDKSKEEKQIIEKEIDLQKNSISEYIKQLELSKNEKNSIITELKKYLTKPQTFENIDNNYNSFKKIIDDKAKEFNELKETINTKKITKDSFNKLENNSKIIEHLSQHFEAKQLHEVSNCDEKQLENLPQNISSLQTGLNNYFTQYQELTNKIKIAESKITEKIKQVNSENSDLQFDTEKIKELLNYPSDYLPNLKTELSNIDERFTKAKQSVKDAEENLKKHHEKTGKSDKELSELEQLLEKQKSETESENKTLRDIEIQLEKNKSETERSKQTADKLSKLIEKFNDWSVLRNVLGSSDGKRLRMLAQTYTLKTLMESANYNLRRLTDKYLLTCQGESMAIFVNDLEMGFERPASTLSGGESFMVSLCLALGLSDMMQNGVQAQTLFIDEGFGTLDEDSLNHVITMLEKLKSQGRQVGIISHVKELQERISAKIRVEKSRGDNTKSIVSVVND